MSGLMTLHLGYRPGCIGRIAELHALYYASTVGFGVAFEAKVAISDVVPVGSATGLIFQVVGDDKVIWNSKPIQAKGDSQDCWVKVEGIDVLELRVVCPGSHAWAHAVWLDPYVLSNKRKP